jgi:antibiotic biosynthesis monooxygenase (ABM) superfamily enzyme
MIISVGGSTVKQGLDPKMEAEEERMVAELDALVRSMPGFISLKDYQAEDGEWITILRFENEEDLRRFRDHPVHVTYQQVVDEYYDAFWVQSAETFREYLHENGERRTGDLSSMFRA